MKQAGYFLVESMVLMMLLIAMTATVALAGKIVTGRQIDGVRVQALYLAQAQIAYLEYQASVDKVLPQGSVGWLGNSSDLQQDEATYVVTAQMETNDASSCLVTAQTQWSFGSHHGTVELQRRLVLHVSANDNDDDKDSSTDVTISEQRKSGEFDIAVT